MAFCPSCGTPAEGRFCPKCGAPIAPGAGAAPPSDPTGTPAPASGLSENVAAALCYLLGLITGILFLVLEPYNKNKNIRFHAFQSLFFNVAWIVLWIILFAVGVILSHIPIIGALISLLLTLVMCLGGLALWLILMFKAYNNQRLVLPIVGPLAEKQS